MTDEKNRSHSKLMALSPELRDALDRKLLAGATYADCSEWLETRGEHISVSMIGRYAQRYLRAFERMWFIRQFTDAAAEDGTERPATQLHETANALMMQKMLKAIIDPDLSVEEKLRAGRSLCGLQNAQVNTERLKILARKEAGPVKAAMTALKARIYDEIGAKYPELAARIVEIADEIGGQNEGAVIGA